MGGFKNETINIAFDNGAINIIIAHLTECSKRMRADCIKNNKPLENHEDRITDRFVAKYLNTEPNDFRYKSQIDKNFDDDTGRHIGRIDIEVISSDYFKVSAQAYFTIECKRIDGTRNLNKKYITEGVARFVTHPIKYSSYYKQNIMFGYVVRELNIPCNADKIDEFQSSLLNEVKTTKFVLKQTDNLQYYVYVCAYNSIHNESIELSHLFFDFSDVVAPTPK